MFLKKSRSKTELFVLLPNKPDKIMSPTNKRHEGTGLNGVERKKIEDSVNRHEIEKDRCKNNAVKEGKDKEENNNVFKDDFAKLMILKTPQKYKETYGSEKVFDFMKMSKKYGKLRIENIKNDFDDFGYNGDSSDQSMPSSEDVARSPTRLSPKERKSVRFEDELSDSISSIDDNMTPVSRRQNNSEHDNKNGNERSLRMTRPTSNLSEETSERRGILTRTFAKNPLNAKREMSFTVENNFRCHQCDKGFKYQSNLKSHVVTVHGRQMFRSGSQTNLRSMDDLLICEVCSLVFKYSVNLRSHKAGHTRNKLNLTI